MDEELVSNKFSVLHKQICKQVAEIKSIHDLLDSVFLTA